MKSIMKKSILTISIILTSLLLKAVEERYHRTIGWENLREIRLNESETTLIAYFTGAQYTGEYGGLPLLRENFLLPASTSAISAHIENMVFDVAPEDFEKINGVDQVKAEIILSAVISYDRKVPYACISFLPARQNPYNGQYEILVSCDIIVTSTQSNAAVREVSTNYKSNSVLASGNWFKLSVTQTGIYKITYNDLENLGINVSSVDPRNIRLYGNGGGMLSESLADSRRDNLAENRIIVSGESDGRFDEQDYILFYGDSPHKWKYEAFSQAFNHEQNIYSDSTYYFLTADLGPGKRVSVLPSSTDPVNVNVAKFTDYAWHERDLFNLANIGRVWFGEIFDVSANYDFSYSFPDLDLSSPAYFRAYTAANSESSSSFKFFNDGNEILSANIAGIPGGQYAAVARPFIGSNWFTPTSDEIKISIDYEKNTSSAQGWLNYFELNVKRNLVYSGAQMSFRDPSSVAPGAIAEFKLGNAGQNVIVWNVTDPANVRRVETSQSGGSLVFRLPNDTLMEFIAFDGSSYLPVTPVGQVANQNLHGAGSREMIIVTNSLFREQAERLAAFHETKDGLTVLVADIAQVYNEFSSGAQDVTAIRDLMKMFYDTAPEGEEPKYLLLFGDASFDYKNIKGVNSNFVPTYEEDESLTAIYSIATDDYFGYLDGPGDNLLDIGIGRFPVQTVEQAALAVDKVIQYATNTPEVMKDWRNYICFIADDEDGNLHLNQAEEMAEFINTNYGVYNLDKIYVDAYPQISTPGGQRAPEVNIAINSRMDKGVLILNYTGHGGEVGLGHERFMEISDITSWNNYNRMPIIITATCEFTRYDDPDRVSAGEYAYNNPNGGAIALFTTVRATFGGSNFSLNTDLFNIMFEKNGNDYYRFGDLIRLAKNQGGVNNNDAKFILIGDPALHLAYPLNEVVTTRINGAEISSIPDTLQALSKITVEGEIVQGTNGSSGFNGTIYPIVFDKPSRIVTLQTDPTSRPDTFDLQNDILYKGKAQVTDGKFNFTFIVPKDIAYHYGFGKISYYAASEEEDASGYFNNILVGGFNTSLESDDEGPFVKLYMNDEFFRFRGITDENPDLLALVSDSVGINTVGSGIGHDIVAILDSDRDNPIVLNDFYQADLNSYSRGTIRFPFYNLEEGLHTLSLKVWDVFNNSSEAYLEFFVMKSEKLIVEDVNNYPNPFNTGTSFVFTHNHSEGQLDVSLRIYSLDGQLVRTFETAFYPTGYRSEPIYWDGNAESGYSSPGGIYIYRIEVTNETGQIDAKTGKLILIK
jgi:hypothetical protein